MTQTMIRPAVRTQKRAQTTTVAIHHSQAPATKRTPVRTPAAKTVVSPRQREQSKKKFKVIRDLIFGLGVLGLVLMIAFSNTGLNNMASDLSILSPTVDNNAPIKGGGKLPRIKRDTIEVLSGPSAVAYFSTEVSWCGLPERLHNASLIVKYGRERKFSDRSIEIALGTAMQESKLCNLHWGDRESQGLFQQQWNQGWGTIKQITTPKYAINKFYDHLSWVKDRDDPKRSMMSVAAQVQRPDMFYYNRDWHWDRAAIEFVKGYSSTSDSFNASGK